MQDNFAELRDAVGQIVKAIDAADETAFGQISKLLDRVAKEAARAQTIVDDIAEAKPLRRCGFCNAWHSAPCGEKCCWSPTDPTPEELILAEGKRL